MKTSNVQTTHSMAIIRGWIDKGITIADASTTAFSIANLTVIGGTITDNGDGTAVLTIGGTGGIPETGDADHLLGIAIQVYSGPTSAPPTEPELEAILGSPVDSAGLTFGVHSTTSGYNYAVQSYGTFYYVTPLTKPLGASTGGSGGGSSPTTVTLTTSPAGGWSWFEDPRALAHGAYTYVGYNSGGTLKVAAVVSGVVVSTAVIASSFEYDDHDSPTLYYEPIHDKLVVTYSRHLGAALYIRTSTNSLTSDPTLSGSFSAAVDLATTFEVSADRFITYPSPVYTNNSDASGLDELWIFYRCHPGGASNHAQWHYNASSDGGVTWPGGSTKLHQITYSKVCSDGVGRIDVASSEHPDDGATKIYHVYRQTAAWHKSDGTSISGTLLPFTGSDMTTVYTASGSDIVWINDIAWSGTVPVIVFTRWPSDDVTDARYMYAVWTGSAWSVHEITTGGTYIPDTLEYPPGTPQDHYAGCVVLDQDDPQIVYASRKVFGQWEIYKYVTANAGVSFTETAITSSSSSKNVRPVGVRTQDDIAAVWLYGDYNDYVNYNVGIKAYEP